MLGHDVVEIILVEVGVHPQTFLSEALVVLRAGQGCEDEELQEIDRQLPLDHPDVALDALGRVIGKSEDVAAVRKHAHVLPRQQHGAVLGDLVLLFLRRGKVVGADVFEPDEHALDAGARRLGNEVRDAVAERINLDDELDVKPSRSRSSMRRSKIGSQSLLRAKLSSVMKKWRMPLAAFSRTRRSTSSGERRRDLRP